MYFACLVVGVLRDCAFKRGSVLSKGPATQAILQRRICPFLPWLSGSLQLWPKFWPETLTHAFIRVNLESQTGDSPTFHPSSAPQFSLAQRLDVAPCLCSLSKQISSNLWFCFWESTLALTFHGDFCTTLLVQVKTSLTWEMVEKKITKGEG